MYLISGRPDGFGSARLSRPGSRGGLLTRRGLRLPLLPVALNRPPVDGQAARECLDRREQPLLKAHDEQAGGRLGLAGGIRVPFLAGGAVIVEQARQLQLRRVRWQPVDDDRFDAPLRKATLRRTDVLLQTPHHHVIERLATAHLHAPGEPVRIEQFQQRREAVRVAVVRRGRQEQPVLETSREVADGPGEL